MAPVIEYLRDLRDQTDAGVGVVHHTGHTGDHMRGTSDLESVWESRLMFKKDGESGLITIETEHREAGDQDSATVAYMLDWNPERRSMRLRSTQLPTEQKCLDWLADNAPATTDEVASGVNIRRTDVARSLANLERAGTACRQPVPRTDAAGRTRNVKCWMTSSQAVFDVETSRPDPGRPGTDNPETTTQAANRPAPLGADEDGVSFRASQTPPEIASDLSEEL
jgi:hypothetical protein